MTCFGPIGLSSGLTIRTVSFTSSILWDPKLFTKVVWYHTTFVNNLGSQNVLETNEPVLIVRLDDGPIGSKHVALYVLLMVITDVLDGNINSLFKFYTMVIHFQDDKCHILRIQ